MNKVDKVGFGKYIAHRGLHGRNVPENSLGAFRAAVKAGIAAELDVQLTKDGRLMVFHDKDLMRMCGVDALLRDFTYAQLKAFRLKDSDWEIPLLLQVLKEVDGKIPLLIELKNYSPVWTIEKRVFTLLEDYDGSYAVESFNPVSMLWFRLYAPNVCRGQLISTWGKKDDPLLRRICAFPIVWRTICKPDFIACDLRSVTLKAAFEAANANADLFTWTANNKELLESAAQFSRCVIGENFPADTDLKEKA